MKKILEIALGTFTSVGGFLEIGSIATAAQAGAEFSFQLIRALVLGGINRIIATAGMTFRSVISISVLVLSAMLLLPRGMKVEHYSELPMLLVPVFGETERDLGTWMKQREIHLELLIGKRVFALNGRPIGRLEEVRAELNARGFCFVTDFLIGSYAFLERLSAWRKGREILRTLHVRRKGSYRVRWEQLDLSDPRRPQLNCEVVELVPLS